MNEPVPQTQNPYVVSGDRDDGTVPEPEAIERSFLGTWVRAAFVTTVAAVPSFLLATLLVSTNAALSTMLFVIVLFSFAFTGLFQTELWKRLWRNQTLRYAIKLTIAIRVVVSVIIPVGFVNDMGIRHTPLRIAESITGEDPGPHRIEVGDPVPPPVSPVFVAIASIFQGVFLTLEMCVVALLAFVVLRLLPHD